MKKLALAFAPIILISAAFGQETVTLPAKPQNPRAGRVLELREVFRISDVQGGFYFKGPSQIQAVPDGGLLVADEDELLRFDAAGKFVVNMYRPGQGPGELRRITDFLVRGTEVLAFQEQPLKCVVSGLDGKFLREFRPDAPVSRLLGLYGDRLLMASNSAIPFDKVKKPEGDILDIVWTLALASPEGAVKATSLAYATKWFAKRLPGAFIANNLTFLLCAPLEGGLVAVVNEDVYGIRIADPAKNAAVRTIRRDYRRVKFEEEKSPDAPAGARSLAEPREYVNDIQRLFAVDGRDLGPHLDHGPGQRGPRRRRRAPAASTSTLSISPAEGCQRARPGPPSPDDRRALAARSRRTRGRPPRGREVRDHPLAGPGAVPTRQVKRPVGTALRSALKLISDGEQEEPGFGPGHPGLLHAPGSGEAS
ncbi:MAG: 6-bladed beta-propeller [Candidatus Moduliflexus flocculans]|nr:6-bladed beta-propeller [Candidatus Moduliflexus flocculans]